MAKLFGGEQAVIPGAIIGGVVGFALSFYNIGESLVHRTALKGYWGVSRTANDERILVLVGGNVHEEHEQARCALNVEQAQAMILELQKQIAIVQARQGV